MKTCGNETGDERALRLNERAYRLRYVSIDSVRTLALKAQRLAVSGEQKCYALENLAFAAYQQMRFSKANALIKQARGLTRNQISQLALDVLAMKVAQRTGDFRAYHLAQVHADEKILRIQDEEEGLTQYEHDRLRYCRSEMHIIASTYFYYLRMDSLSRAELLEVGRDVEDMRDTAQWLNFRYMTGSGGYYRGTEEDVHYHEMEDLFRVLSVARRSGNLYFQGNAMQAIAEHTGSDDMARNAQEAFAAYKDIFQEGAALRTRAELAFDEGRYKDALGYLLEAKGLVEEQHRRDTLPELQWESRIYEHLSMVYSALEEKENSRLYRLRYLDCLELMRQDIDVESRQLQVIQSQRSLYVKLTAFVLLSLFTLVAFALLMRSIKRRGRKHKESLEEKLVGIGEEADAMTLRLHREKVANIERRTKVALAASVIPFIERLLHPSADAGYIRELTEEIERLGGVLTQWIQIQKGQLNVGITTFALQPLLDTIALNRPTFERQGITLTVPQTEAEVKADRVLTLFMLNTLCDNARKYTPEGGRVDIEVEETEQYVEIAVKDSGCGFDAERSGEGEPRLVSPGPHPGGDFRPHLVSRSSGAGRETTDTRQPVHAQRRCCGGLGASRLGGLQAPQRRVRQVAPRADPRPQPATVCAAYRADAASGSGVHPGGAGHGTVLADHILADGPPCAPPGRAQIRCGEYAGRSAGEGGATGLRSGPPLLSEPNPGQLPLYHQARDHVLSGQDTANAGECHARSIA